MRRNVSLSGTVDLHPSVLYHVACSMLVPVRAYGYQRVSKGVGSGDIDIYVDMVCGSCGIQLSLGCPEPRSLDGRVLGESQM
jgi:hypothetical protein